MRGQTVACNDMVTKLVPPPCLQPPDLGPVLAAEGEHGVLHVGRVPRNTVKLYCANNIVLRINIAILRCPCAPRAPGASPDEVRRALPERPDGFVERV